MIALLTMFVIPIFAQEPPADWLGVVENFSTWFGTFAGIAALGVFIAGFFNGLLNISKKFTKQLVAWAVCIILASIGNLANVGFLAEATWLMTILYGLGAGLAANGIFDAPLVHAVILAIEQALKKE